MKWAGHVAIMEEKSNAYDIDRKARIKETTRKAKT
jgi:hypothetical protein